MTLEPVAWWQAEPARLQRDREEIAARFPTLTYDDSGQGAWWGQLPVWPFERVPPDGLDALVPAGLKMILTYGAAYPVVSPMIFPFDPAPEPLELTQTRWHVLGSGALCQFQTQADWEPSSSVLELLLKAAGWRIEYALLKAEAATDMSMAGIVHDSSLDDLISAAAHALANTAPPSLGDTRASGQVDR